jgi:hypothetical protein
MQLRHLMRWPTTRAIGLATAAVLGLAGLSTTSAHGQTTQNTAIEWSTIASTAIFSPPPVGTGQPPHSSVLSMAMVQGAVYDAVNAIDGGHTPYLVAPPADPTDSKEAAAATAAFRVLVGFPDATPALPGVATSQLATLQPLYDATLATIGDGPAKTGGVEVGEAAARAMLLARQGDGRFGTYTYTPGTDVGDWRPGPPQGPAGTVAVDPAPWVGFVRPFLVPDVDMLRTDGPHAVTSDAYAKDFAEVKRLGSLNSTRRTAEQTMAAIFWQDHGIAIWNRVFRQLATNHELDIVDSARLLAMGNLAGADGSIGCWNDKAYYSFWRPITAIRAAATDGNPATVADADWVPLFDPTVAVSGAPLVTPGFPDHPSGHGCISGAIVTTLRSFFGTDKVAITVVSNKCSPAPCPNRTFDRLSLALKEIIDARVWGGIHFRTADVQGAVLGKKVAKYLEKHYFLPT